MTVAQFAALFIAPLACAHAQTAIGAAKKLQLSVATTGAFTSAANQLAPRYLHDRQIEVNLQSGGSVGNSASSIPVWLDRGDLFDVVIVSDSSLDDLIRSGKILPASKVQLVLSDIGLAFKAGAPKPDVHNAEALKQALLAAQSITYTPGVSGIYVRDVMFPKLGIANQMQVKTLVVQNAGQAVADGKAQFGIQQVSELMAVKGVEVLHMPRDAAEPTIFSVGIPVNAPHPKDAREFIEWLASPAAYSAIRESGLEPFHSK
jgi:molybdate transport system substrate-binding protein